jgi:hypothetical protein
MVDAAVRDGGLRSEKSEPTPGFFPDPNLMVMCYARAQPGHWICPLPARVRAEAEVASFASACFSDAAKKSLMRPNHAKKSPRVRPWARKVGPEDSAAAVDQRYHSNQ